MLRKSASDDSLCTANRREEHVVPSSRETCKETRKGSLRAARSAESLQEQQICSTFALPDSQTSEEATPAEEFHDTITPLQRIPRTGSYDRLVSMRR